MKMDFQFLLQHDKTKNNFSKRHAMHTFSQNFCYILLFPAIICFFFIKEPRPADVG
jgi:hypothetical protein